MRPATYSTARSAPRSPGSAVSRCISGRKSQGDLSGLYAYGVTQLGADLTKSVGDQSISYALLPADGQIRNNNATIGNVDPQPERVCLGLFVYLSPTVCTCTWTKDGTALYTQTLPNGKTWVAGFSLGGDTPGDISMVVNADRIASIVRSIATAGRGRARGSQRSICRWQTPGFMALTANGSMPAYTAFVRAMLNKNDISVDRFPIPWFQRSNSRANPASIGTVRLVNTKGAFNDLRSADIKDSPLVLRKIAAPPGAAGDVANATVEFTGSLDKVSDADYATLNVTLRDALSAH